MQSLNIKVIFNSQIETVDIYLLWLLLISILCPFSSRCSSLQASNKPKCYIMEMVPLKIRHRIINSICFHPITVQFASAFGTGTTVKGCANLLLSNACFLFPNHKRNLNGLPNWMRESGAGDGGNDNAHSTATGNVGFVHRFHRNKNAAKSILVRNRIVGFCVFTRLCSFWLVYVKPKKNCWRENDITVETSDYLAGNHRLSVAHGIFEHPISSCVSSNRAFLIGRIW